MSESNIIMILGGARSGKSSFAQSLAQKMGEKVVYLATAVVQDEEMAQRVHRHRQERPEHWITIEEGLDLSRAIRTVPPDTEVILLDCLTFWLTNLLWQEEIEDYNDINQLKRKEQEVLAATDDFLQTVSDTAIPLIVVSNEVGCSLVPEYPLGRFFRDLSGWANQKVAKKATSLYLMVAGCPLLVKGE